MPTAQAAWNSNANVPDAFRPGRDVTFAYSVQSTSGADIPLQWHVRLLTCMDANANGYCEGDEPQYVNHGEKGISLFAGQSGTLSWTVNLQQPEGAYRYHFVTRCTNDHSKCWGGFRIAFERACDR